jgi:hypothetical protein
VIKQDVLKKRWRQPMLLALGVWALFYVTNIAFTAALNFPASAWLFIAVWALHGLALTWPLHLLLVRSQGLPATLRWLAVGVALIPLTWMQGWLDAQAARELSEWLRSIRGPGTPIWIMLSRGGELQEIGTQVSLLIYFWVFSAYAVAASLLLAQRRLFDSERRAQEAELEALRLRLNPHFLFNALNSVSSLIVTGRHQEADQTTLHLADFLSGALSVGGGLVRLEDELSTLDAYLQVERVRYGDRLAVEVAVPSELLNALIPSFALQPLVENAVKYAVAPAVQPVTIRVAAALEDGALRLSVEDDGDPARAARVPRGTGVGLGATRDRLRALFGDDARLETERRPNGFVAVMRFPLRRSPEARRLLLPQAA